MPRPKPNAHELIKTHILDKGCEVISEINQEKFNKNTLLKIKCGINNIHIFTMNITNIMTKNIDLSNGCPHCLKNKKYNEMGIHKEVIENYSINNKLDYEPKKEFYNRWTDSIVFTCLNCKDSFEIKALGHFETNTSSKRYNCKKCYRIELGIKSQDELIQHIKEKQLILDGPLYDVKLLPTIFNKNMSEELANKFKDSKWHIVEYNGTKLHGIFQCKECGFVKNTYPHNIFITGMNCNNCRIIRQKIQVQTKILNICKDSNIYPLDQIFYVNTGSPIKFKCNFCTNLFEKTWASITGNRYNLSCPKCFKGTKRKQQTEVQNYLEVLLSRKLSNDNRDIISPLELDIYDETTKVAIEFCGLNWHSTEYKVDPNYHKNKYDLCKEKGIRLITIFSDEWGLKKYICQSRLAHIFGKTPTKVGARKTTCKVIENSLALKFCEENHIQGKGSAHISYGLYNNEELVSVMTFSKPSVSKNASNSYDWELNRFCSKLGSIVMGGANKLLKEFRNTHKNDKLITFCDLRWGTGSVYDKLGFNFEYITKPNYYYVGEGTSFERKHRFNYTKQKLIDLFKADPIRTEEEIANENGLFRIYDCGHMKFSMIC